MFYNRGKKNYKNFTFLKCFMHFLQFTFSVLDVLVIVQDCQRLFVLHGIVL